MTLTPTEALPLLAEQIDLLLQQATSARGGSMKLPSIGDGPVVVSESLQDARSRLDLVEWYLNTLVRIRSDVRALHSDASALHDDEWNRLIGEAAVRGRGASGWGEPAPRERYAAVDLQLLPQRVRVRQASELLDRVMDACDIVQRLYRGLDKYREDLHVVLRAMVVESSLER